MSDSVGSVKLEFKSLTEAYRVRRIVEMWNPANEDLIPWRDELVSRMGLQLDAIERFSGLKNVKERADEIERMKGKMYHCDMLVEALKKHLSSCDYFKTYVINNKSGFDCTGCGDKNVCEALMELIRDGKTESKWKK